VTLTAPKPTKETEALVRNSFKKCLFCRFNLLLFGTVLFSISGNLKAGSVDFEIITDPVYAPPYLDESRTEIGVLNAEIIETSEDLGRSISDNEEFLSRSYELFRRADYEEPALGPRVINRNTGLQRFRVYQFNFDEYGWNTNAYGVYMAEAGCLKVNKSADNRSWLAINSQKLGGRPFERMSNLTHELFHAFEYAYPLFYTEPCTPEWITEGLADAAANFVTEHSFLQNFKANRKNFNRASLRSYRIAFQDEYDWLKKDGYFQTEYAPLLLSSGNAEVRQLSKTRGARAAVMYLTSGFWQFLARRSTGIRPDYSSPGEIANLMAVWLPLLQNNPENRISSQMGWLRVVNDYIANNLPLQKSKEVDVLYGWLPEFFTEFASWWYLRHQNIEEEFWLKHAFGGCEKITLKPGFNATRSSEKISFTGMAKNSARCIDVKLEGFTNPINLKFKADNFGKSDPDQFHLGMAHVKIPGSSFSPFNCWNKHHDSTLLQCRRLGKAENKAKTWKAEQISTKTLGIEEGPVDATLTYVFSNVSPAIDNSATVETVDLTVTAFYNFGGDKDFAPPNSIRPQEPAQLSQIMTGDNKKRIFYRLYTAPPTGVTGMFPIELNEIESGEQPRCGGDSKNTYCAYETGGDYYIRPGPNISFGQTGRILATVHRNSVDGPPLMSTYCGTDADQKAVEILDSSEEGIVIRVSTDLCDVPGPNNNFCGRQPTCPVRDHLLTTMTLGLGREHFGETAPVHKLTPGTRFDMDLYFRYGVPTESFSSSSDPGGDSGGDADSGPTTGSGPPESSPDVPGGSSTGDMLDSCACTCEERESTLRKAEDLKARKEAGEEISGNAFMALMKCTSDCQTEYMICEMEKNK